MIEIVGWSSGFFLAICGAPQALKCFQQKHAHGISTLYILLWMAGVALGLVFIGLTPMALAHKLPLYFNYLFNLLFTVVILRYRLWPGSDGSSPKKPNDA
jgi:uncharacterized protein with PQ loop repeat